MARGGRRTGAGRPPKPLADKILEGNPGKRPLKVLEFTGLIHEEITIEVPENLSDEGRSIFITTVEWLRKTGCLKLINPQHIEEYALCRSRWLECEAMNSRHGLLTKNQATGQPIRSPFVDTAILYLKQADAAWNKIHAVVKENCAQEFKEHPHQDAMERLLTSKR